MKTLSSGLNPEVLVTMVVLKSISSFGGELERVKSATHTISLGWSPCEQQRQQTSNFIKIVVLIKEVKLSQI